MEAVPNPNPNKEKWPTLTSTVVQHKCNGRQFEVGLESGIPNTILEYRELKTVSEETETQIGKSVWERYCLLLSTDCDARCMLIDGMKKGDVGVWWAFMMATKFAHDFSPALHVVLGWDFKQREPCIMLMQAAKTIKEPIRWGELGDGPGCDQPLNSNLA